MGFSLKWVLAGTAYLALGCFMLASPSFYWASLLWTGTLVIIGVAVAGMISALGRKRAFCCGFAVVAGGHMLLALGPWIDQYTGELLFTRQLLDQLGAALEYEVPTLAEMPGLWRNMQYAATAEGGQGFGYLSFLVAGHSMGSVLLGVLGGGVTCWLYTAPPKENHG